LNVIDRRNPIYAIMETRQRWLRLMSISWGAGVLGSIMFVAWGWSHVFARVWLCVGLGAGLFFAIWHFLEWKAAVSQAAGNIPEADDPT